MNIKKEILSVFLTILAAIVSTLALYIFVYPSNFVPLGLEAIITMIHVKTGFSAGILTLIFNLPLIVYAWFKLNKRYVIYTLLFTVLSSVLLEVYGAINLFKYLDSEKSIAAIFAGVMLGVRTGVMLKIGSSTGGVDIIAQIIQKKLPYVNLERIITIICCVIIGVSYFVYNDFSCILLALVSMVICEFTTSLILRDSREAIEVKIITKNAEEISAELITELNHTATVIDAEGMYKKENNKVVLAVINRRELPTVMNIVKKYDETFVYYTDVKGVYGKFRRHKTDPL
jgi:uncharacterized membrane-anchored protein YitT (DUF2179 family)